MLPIDKSHQIKTEVDLSPYVIRYWTELGFCVHGEVAVYGKSVFIDHVAHTGPCSDPDHIVAIEMKKGASKSLLSQMTTLDTRHLADELWAVTISTPRKDTLERWNTRVSSGKGMWLKPGLLSWEGDGFKKHHHACVSLRPYHKRYYRKKGFQLLLVPENQGTLGGYPSGSSDHTYITHWSLSLDRIKAWASGLSGFTTEDLYANLPPEMAPYRKKRSAMNRMLRFLREEGYLKKVGKEGRYNKYAVVL